MTKDVTKAIVCTTINLPTPALRKFAAEHSDWRLIIVADRKTPDGYQEINCDFMSCEFQHVTYPKLSDMLGWNNVDRRNLGFLYAYQLGAEIVAMVDDDNIPKPNWGDKVVVGRKGRYTCYRCNAPAFDPLSVTNDPRLWHRGFPVELVYSREMTPQATVWEVTPLVQADLWDDDPDVDAIARMVHRPSVVYNHSEFYMGSAMSPFNMQNTFVHRSAMKHMISIPFTGRMCDIWGAYYLQSVYPRSVVYGPSSVIHRQDRSDWSVIKDLLQEQNGYEHTLDLVEGLQRKGPDYIFESPALPEKAKDFIRAYQEHF